jgi:hypothetical protein
VGGKIETILAMFPFIEADVLGDPKMTLGPVPNGLRKQVKKTARGKGIQIKECRLLGCDLVWTL